eukprot:82490-Karenia_brevis.AAC.1
MATPSQQFWIKPACLLCLSMLAMIAISAKKGQTFTILPDSRPAVLILVFKPVRALTKDNSLLGKSHLDVDA